MKLFVFDFDHTTTSDHTHNIIMHAIRLQKQLGITTLRTDKDAQWDLVKHIKPIGLPADWEDLFRSILDTGNEIAFASYNSFGMNIIPRYLKDVLKLPDDILSRIRVISFLPSPADQVHGKNLHIEALLKAYVEKPEVIVIDDSESILEAAEEKDYVTILATADASHLAKAKAALTATFKKSPEKKSSELYLVADLSTVNVANLINDFVITAKHELYQITENGEALKIDADINALKHLFRLIDIDPTKILQEQPPKVITSLINSSTQARQLFYNFFLPPEERVAIQEEVVATSKEQNLRKIKFTRDQKVIFEEPNTFMGKSLREVMWSLESSKTVTPMVRNRYNFFIHSTNILLEENIDKKLREVVESVYNSKDEIPEDITIELIRKKVTQ